MSNSLRDAPPLFWPALRRPDGGGKLVYLDQKHWVHLAQADTGHPGGTCYAAALQAARAARAAGTAIFPLSVVHYSETLKITSVKHRSDLARLTEELSGFAALPTRRLTAQYELDAAVTAAIGIEPSVLPVTDLIGRGFPLGTRCPRHQPDRTARRERWHRAAPRAARHRDRRHAPVRLRPVHRADDAPRAIGR